MKLIHSRFLACAVLMFLAGLLCSSFWNLLGALLAFGAGHCFHSAWKMDEPNKTQPDRRMR